jgi:hypothetical protein
MFALPINAWKSVRLRTSWTFLDSTEVRMSHRDAQAPAPEPVPAFVVNELPGADGVYNARVYTAIDAFQDAMAEADRLGLTDEERIEALAGVLRGAQPYSSNKAGKQPAGRGAGGGPQGGRDAPESCLARRETGGIQRKKKA